MREVVDVDYILVDNVKEALALENNLIKQHQPKFNILLRDDKTTPTFATPHSKNIARLRHPPSEERRLNLFWPVFPCRLGLPFSPPDPQTFSWSFLHRRFRAQPSAPMLAVLHSSLSRPCVKELVTDERYAEAARDVRLFLEGRRSDLAGSVRAAHASRSEEERFEEAAGFRDLLRTLTEMEER